MKTYDYRYFVGDFETTVYKGQVHTEVWASACVEMYTEDVKIFHSIREQFNYLVSLNSHICIYYHNLKFDGAFWLAFLLNDLKFTQAGTQLDEDDINSFRFQNKKEMKNNTFTYSISSTGLWYTITIKVRDKIIEIRDSLKLLPFSVKKIGKSFGTKHKKLDMEYEGFRYAGCEITDKEKHYIANDVLVVKEALEIMFNEGHKKLTIGSCCLAEYKKSIATKNYKRLFPDVYEMPLDKETYRYETVGDYIKSSYRGGWCYVVKGKENIIYKKGVTADVNSLYPSMMHSSSGNKYPVEEPTFWSGDFIPHEALRDDRYFFIRIKTRFKIKKDKLPFIQIKNNWLYPPREMLETSDVYNSETKEYSRYYIDLDGNTQMARPELCLTMTDYKLLLDHYDLEDFEILDGCYFRAVVGIFDKYIDKYAEIKKNNKGAKREEAKLFLNNLYGKMASSKNSSFKVSYLKEDKSVGFYTVTAYEKLPGYIPVGSAITSYARNFTIRTAQQNYYGKNKRGFIYADTDSIHCDLNPEELRGLTIHPTEFNCWDLEAQWDLGLFVRPKTYIEHITHEGLEEVTPNYNVKCAGMPQRCKDLFLYSVDNSLIPDGERFNEDEEDFLLTKRSISDFKIGLAIPSKLLPKTIRGGVLLTPSTYQMR